MPHAFVPQRSSHYGCETEERRMVRQKGLGKDEGDSTRIPQVHSSVGLNLVIPSACHLAKYNGAE